MLALLLCDYANKTDSHKFNLIGSFDRIQFGPDSKSHNFFLYIRTANTIDGPVRISFQAPSGRETAWMEFTAKMEGAPAGTPIQPELAFPVKFAAEEAGDHWLGVTYNGQCLGGMRLTVSMKKENDADDDDNE